MTEPGAKGIVRVETIVGVSVGSEGSGDMVKVAVGTGTVSVGVGKSVSTGVFVTSGVGNCGNQGG